MPPLLHPLQAPDSPPRVHRYIYESSINAISLSPKQQCQRQRHHRFIIGYDKNNNKKDTIMASEDSVDSIPLAASSSSSSLSFSSPVSSSSPPPRSSSSSPVPVSASSSSTSSSSSSVSSTSISCASASTPPPKPSTPALLLTASSLSVDAQTTEALSPVEDAHDEDEDEDEETRVIMDSYTVTKHALLDLDANLSYVLAWLSSKKKDQEEAPRRGVSAASLAELHALVSAGQYGCVLDRAYAYASCCCDDWDSSSSNGSSTSSTSSSSSSSSSCTGVVHHEEDPEDNKKSKEGEGDGDDRESMILPLLHQSWESLVWYLTLQYRQAHRHYHTLRRMTATSLPTTTTFTSSSTSSSSVSSSTTSKQASLLLVQSQIQRALTHKIDLAEQTCAAQRGLLLLSRRCRRCQTALVRLPQPQPQPHRQVQRQQ